MLNFWVGLIASCCNGERNLLYWFSYSIMYLFICPFFPEFSDTDAGGHMSFDPVHFIRSHSKNNDPADIQTQVRNIFTICTGWVICIWTILWGCLEVTGWLKMKNFNSSKKFMQLPLKVNKVYFFDIKHGLTMTFWNLFSKSKNYTIPI